MIAGGPAQYRGLAFRVSAVGRCGRQQVAAGPDEVGARSAGPRDPCRRGAGRRRAMGLAAIAGKSPAGRVRRTSRVRPVGAQPDGVRAAAAVGVGARPLDVVEERREGRGCRRIDRPAASCAGRPLRSGPIPSEKVSPSRSVKTTVRPSSRSSQRSASAGRGVSVGSMAVRPSNSWAMTAALPASPATAGSSGRRLAQEDPRRPVGRRPGNAAPAASPRARPTTATRERGEAVRSTRPGPPRADGGSWPGV